MREAPIGAGVLLVGVLDKVGTFGFLRYCLPLFPAASQTLAPLVLVLAVIGISTARSLAAGQTDMKRFVTYTSIAHFGFIALGIFAFTTQAVSARCSTWSTTASPPGMLFLVVGMLIARGGSRLDRRLRRHARSWRRCSAGCSSSPALATLALPGTNSFVSEFLVLIGSFPPQPVYTIIATVGIVLAALYVLWLYQRTMQGPVRGNALVERVRRRSGRCGRRPGRRRHAVVHRRPDRRELAVLTPLVVLICCSASTRSRCSTSSTRRCVRPTDRCRASAIRCTAQEGK